MPSLERQRLDALLDETDQVFRDAFAQFVRTVQSPKVMAAITERLEAGDTNGALDIVQSHVVTLGQSIPRAFQLAGEAAAIEALAELSNDAIGFAFDPTNPRAAAIIRQETLSLIREFSARQIETTREALGLAFDEGAGTFGAARAFRDSIGLTRRQAAAVRNYGRLLRDGSAEALNRDIRDRRFDRTVRRAVRGERALSGDQVERMTTRYRERYLMYRSENIARTESVRATSMAREESFRQLAEQTGVGERIRRIWNSTLDKRTRDQHVPMNGQVRRMNEAFQDGDGNRLLFPGDPSAPAETTINCRCVLTLRIVPPG